MGQRDQMHPEEFKDYLQFIMDIEKGFLEFKQLEEDLLLFGKAEESADVKRAQPDYTILAVSQSDF